MKDDVQDLPAEVPRKRRQIEALLDLHIAMWLAGDDISPSDRRRLEAEKARRKALSPDRPVGLVVAEEGVTPEQLDAIKGMLASVQPTELHHPGVASSKLHGACKAIAPVVVHHDGVTHHERAQEVVRASEIVVFGTKEPAVPKDRSGVWSIIRYAKNRSLPVRVVLSTGAVQAEGEG